MYRYCDTRSVLRVELKPPENAKSTCVYAVKLEARTVSSDAFDQEVNKLDERGNDLRTPLHAGACRGSPARTVIVFIPLFEASNRPEKV